MDIDEVLQSIQNDEMAGFCRACGARHECIEPDARNYECEECGEMEVFGAEELLIMGELG